MWIGKLDRQATDLSPNIFHSCVCMCACTHVCVCVPLTLQNFNYKTVWLSGTVLHNQLVVSLKKLLFSFFFCNCTHIYSFTLLVFANKFHSHKWIKLKIKWPRGKSHFMVTSTRNRRELLHCSKRIPYLQSTWLPLVTFLLEGRQHSHKSTRVVH